MERKEYAGAHSAGTREGREQSGAKDLLEKILERDNLNQAYQRVRRNHGAPGIDGMTVEAALPWMKTIAKREPRLFAHWTLGWLP